MTLKNSKTKTPKNEVKSTQRNSNRANRCLWSQSTSGEERLCSSNQIITVSCQVSASVFSDCPRHPPPIPTLLLTTGWLAILPQWGNWTSLAPNPPWQPQPSTSAISAKPTTQWAKNGRKRPKNTSLLGEKWVNPLPLLPWLYGSGAMTTLLAIISDSDMTCLYNVSSKPKTKIHISVEPLLLGCIVRFVC